MGGKSIPLLSWSKRCGNERSGEFNKDEKKLNSWTKTDATLLYCLSILVRVLRDCHHDRCIHHCTSAPLGAPRPLPPAESSESTTLETPASPIHWGTWHRKSQFFHNISTTSEDPRPRPRHTHQTLRSVCEDNLILNGSWKVLYIYKLYIWVKWKYKYNTSFAHFPSKSILVFSDPLTQFFKK